VNNSPKNNVAASVRQRLLNLRQQRQEDFSLILAQFAIERLLYRLGQSAAADQFVLKGATLFLTWTGKLHRPTQDLDLLGYGDSSADALRSIFTDLCTLAVQVDGLDFDPNTITLSEIREGMEYGGQRIQLVAYLGRARIPLQIDIGFGDVVTPQADWIDYPTLLQFPTPRLRTYTKESVIAEKFHAMVTLGILNSRLKDFYDLWTLSRLFPFDGALLAQAIQATFTRRNTAIPVETPVALTREFADNLMKVTQWQAFLKRNQLTVNDRSFAEVIGDLAEFLLPPVQALAQSAAFSQHWTAATQWR
jgi:hypothetical protein